MYTLYYCIPLNIGASNCTFLHHSHPEFPANIQSLSHGAQSGGGSGVLADSISPFLAGFSGKEGHHRTYIICYKKHVCKLQVRKSTCRTFTTSDQRKLHPPPFRTLRLPWPDSAEETTRLRLRLIFTCLSLQAWNRMLSERASWISCFNKNITCLK